MELLGPVAMSSLSVKSLLSQCRGKVHGLFGPGTRYISSEVPGLKSPWPSPLQQESTAAADGVTATVQNHPWRCLNQEAAASGIDIHIHRRTYLYTLAAGPALSSVLASASAALTSASSSDWPQQG